MISKVEYFKSLLICVTCAFSSSISCGADIDQEDFADVYQSAHFLGRGHTGTALADYEDSLFYNPAGLALYQRAPHTKAAFVRFRTFEENINGTKETKGLYKRLLVASPMIEASGVLKDAYDNLSPDSDPLEIGRELLGKSVHVGGNNFSGLILRNFGVGVFTSTRADGLVAKDPDFGGLETAKSRVNAFSGVTAGLAVPVIDNRLFVGVAFRAIHRGKLVVRLDPSQSIEEVKDTLENNEGYGRGFGYGRDLGLMTQASGVRLGGNTYKFSGGLQVRDVGGTRFSLLEGENDDLDIPQTVNVGFAVDILAGKTYVRLLADYRDILSSYDIPDYQKFGAGIELWFNGNVGAQAGIIDGNLTAGAFIDFILLRLDGGFYSEEMGYKKGARPDRRLFARLMVGF